MKGYNKPILEKEKDPLSRPPDQVGMHNGQKAKVWITPHSLLNDKGLFYDVWIISDKGEEIKRFTDYYDKVPKFVN